RTAGAAQNASPPSRACAVLRARLPCQFRLRESRRCVAASFDSSFAWRTGHCSTKLDARTSAVNIGNLARGTFCASCMGFQADMEYLEIVAPADFKTIGVEARCAVPDPEPWT